MAIETVELMHECFPTHWRMGTARTKEEKETAEGKQKRVKIAQATESPRFQLHEVVEELNN